MRSSPSGRFVFLLMILLAVGMVVRVHRINGCLPYPYHFDEPWISQQAVRIMQSGDFNPHTFWKPSLPIYLTVAGFTVGYFSACKSSRLCNVDKIGNVGYPYYAHRNVVRPARMLFAAFSIVSLALVGFIAFQLSGLSPVLLVAPLALSLSATYFTMSWSYLNPDIIGCTFVLAALACLYRAPTEDPTLFEGAIAPGIFCGLAMGSKYNLAVVVVPCLLAIWLSPSRAKILAPSALLLSAAATFLVVAPYTLLDFRSFLNDFGSQIADYSRGEKASGFDWGRFTAYFGHVVGDYGWASALFAAAGLVFIARSDWKRSLGLSAFIVLLPWLMSSYPRLYSRNVLPLFALYAVLVAVGVVCLWPWAVAQCSRWRLRSIDPRILGISAGIAIAAIVVASLPWNKLVAAYDLSSDSRNLTVRWIKRNVPTGSTILVPKELLMNVGSLVPHYQVVVKPFDRLEAVPGSENLYLLVPSFGHRRPGGRSLAESCRQQAEVLGGTPLVTFGRKPVLVDYPRPAAYGNPVIQIRKLG